MVCPQVSRRSTSKPRYFAMEDLRTNSLLMNTEEEKKSFKFAWTQKRSFFFSFYTTPSRLDDRGTRGSKTEIEHDRGQVQGRATRAAGNHGVGQQHGRAAKRTTEVLPGMRVQKFESDQKQ